MPNSFKCLKFFCRQYRHLNSQYCLKHQPNIPNFVVKGKK